MGAGAVANVYLGHDRLLDRHVAIKALRPDASASPEFLERFKREARAAASLNHPNIVAIFDWGEVPLPDWESQYLYFIVMEYVPGPNLKEVIRQRGPRPEAEALAITAQVAAALDAAHRAGVIHRDVKPHNILLTEDARAKVTDFGIARAMGVTQLTSTNIVLGTAHYLSPEQAQAGKVDRRSDLYSLGVVLYELLTAHEPFTGSSPLEVALHHAYTPAPSPRELRQDLSPTTEALVLRALAKHPDQRYQSAEEMRVALQEAQEHLRRKAAADVTDPVPLVVTPASQRRQEPRERVVPARSLSAWLLAVPLLLILIVAGSAVILSSGLLGSAPSHPAGYVARGVPTATPRIVHRQPVTARRDKSTARPMHRHQAVPTSTRKSAPRGTTKLHRAPPPHPAPVSAAPAASPAPAATPMPTAVPAPQPTAVIAVAEPSTGSTPMTAVSRFYTLVANHDFSQAAQLWSQNMINTWGVQEGIVHRFSSTTTLQIKTMRLISQADGHASVAVDLLEWKGASSQPQELIGTWDLVSSPSGWLLDQAHF